MTPRKLTQPSSVATPPAGDGTRASAATAPYGPQVSGDRTGQAAPQAPAGGKKRRAVGVPPAGLQAIAAKMSEATLEEHVRELCKDLGIIRIHVYNSRGTTPGVPDDILVGPHGILWRELKTMRGKVTQAQQAMGEALLSAGQNWGVWRPSLLLNGEIARELAALAGLKVGAA